MRGQKLLAAGLMGSAALLTAGVLPAQAQGGLDGRVQGLERRMDGLESGMQEMLRMMREQQQQGRANPQGQAPAVSSPMQAGRISLGVCALNWQWGRNEPLPEECAGLPATSAVVAVPRAFGFDEAVKTPQFRPHLDVGTQRAVGLVWSGVIRITQAGSHHFQINLRFSERLQQFEGARCTTTIQVSDRVVARTSGWLQAYGDRTSNFSGQGRADLVTGLYPVRLFLGCHFDRDVPRLQQLVGVSLDLAEPGDAAFRPLQADRLGTRQ